MPKKNYEEEEIEITEVIEEECKIDAVSQYTYYDEEKGVNRPVLTSGMTPIKWDEELNEITTTDNDPDWYDHGEKRWANAKTADGSYWVWVPRYAYKITSGYHTSNAGTIEIKFLKENTNEAADGMIVETSGYSFGEKDTSSYYFLHPAFTFGEEGIPGFWVAKFEVSVADQSDACYTEPNENNCNKTTLEPKIMPNASSWRYIKIGNMFDVSLNMKNSSIYGWSEAEVDTHMMKNIEWGAVAYLSKSEYGANDEVWINNSSTFTTGCAGDSVSADSYDGCQNAYNTANGVKASTTHNIYGIYDMSGGAWERVAAYIDNGNSYLSNGQSIINANSKYKDVYIMGTSDTQADNYLTNANKYGEAIYETSNGNDSSNSWYNDYSRMPYSGYSWFPRGGRYDSDVSGGVFSFSLNDGDVILILQFSPGSYCYYNFCNIAKA